MRAGASAATAPPCASSTAHHTWSRHYLEFDLALAPREAPARDRCSGASRGLRRWPAPVTVLDRAVELSARHGVAVCKALGGGVLDALELLLAALASAPAPRAAGPVRAVADRALPRALPAVRRSAGPGADVASGLPRPLQPRGDRHDAARGASVPRRVARRPGDLAARARRLLRRRAHGHARSTDGCSRRRSARRSIATPIDDASWAAVDPGASARPPPVVAGRARIAYRDLDVEQLGAVYEHVLDYEPDRHAARDAGADRRCAKVERHLLHAARVTAVSGAADARAAGPRIERADEILALRVLDPAMGSGAFLVGACRYPGAAVEDGAGARGPLARRATSTAADRAALRRDDRAALSVRRRSESDGRAAGAAVAVARHAGGRQAADRFSTITSSPATA